MTQGINHYNVGEAFEGFLLIKNVTNGTTSAGKPFLTLQLGDTTGSIDAKLWNVTEDDITTYTNGTVVELKANIIDFRGSAQLQMQQILVSDATKEMLPEDFMEKAPISKRELQDEIDQTIFEIQNTTIRGIVRSFIERYNHEFFVYPAAASIHHAFISGLAYHTVTMLRIAKSLCSIYPELNKDLLYAGVILHDIGKIHEFTSATDTTRSRDGNLLGHIPIMASEIKEVANELSIEKDNEEIALLQHMVLSHHGKPEWGSARTPLIQEAEILHMIDNIDAKMNTMTKVLSKTNAGEFTEKMFALDNRSFYKPLI
ncbi:HD domain-containing protein [Virgibacillus sp. AGTR]|uniref:HD domain-containing protein n=1 Tax=Virgibacillus sp. AGTR TaxID=2812055 RepID=UPI001D16D869|nr:HD domain-containing protein [Virgibacillus sp. AGTR]MCC2248932.1 HD domain-containing protein [Virgibacillus sp. AGTR]